MGKYRSNVFYGNSVKRKQKMEDKKITQGITPENFLEPRTWTSAGYSQQLQAPSDQGKLIPGGKSWS